MAKRKKGKTTKKEEEPTPEPEPEEAPEVKEELPVVEEIEEPTEKKAKTKKGLPDAIWVSHTGFAGAGQTHGGRAGKHNYVFGGSATKVLVTDPIDIAFFLKKAERNPNKWRVE